MPGIVATEQQAKQLESDDVIEGEVVDEQPKSKRKKPAMKPAAKKKRG